MLLSLLELFANLVTCDVHLERFKGTAKLVLVATSMLIGGAIAACVIQPELLSEIESAIRHSAGESLPPLKAILIWIGASFVAFLSWCYRFGITDITQAFRALRNARQPASGNSSSNGTPKGLSTTAQKNRFLAKINANQGIDTYAYNMFDPAELPPRLAEYAGMVYSACEDLGNFFGFQDSSVRNEAEHLLCLLSNHRRYMTVLPLAIQPPSPIHALHAKVRNQKHCQVNRTNQCSRDFNNHSNRCCAPPL
jgi:callose synthase